MSLRLATPIGDLFGVGPILAKDFARLGINNIRDLLWYVPFRYDDFSSSKPIPSLYHDDVVTLIGTIKTIRSRRSMKSSIHMTEAIFENDSGALKVLWFNQPYLEKVLRPGTVVSLAGRINRKFGETVLMNPVHEPAAAHLHTGSIVPVYGLTGSLTTRRVRALVKKVLPAATGIVDWLPDEVRETESFPMIYEALNYVHFPPSADHLDHGMNRLKFDELFLRQLMFAHLKRERAIIGARQLVCPIEEIKSFVEKLPFKLTNAQRKAAWEIVLDLAKPEPMHRLLQGDVGSGKTVVAAIGALAALKAGGRVVYLAPTEILAEQQYKTFQKILSEFKPALLTSKKAMWGSDEVKKKDLLAALQAGEVACAIGTHALFEETAKMPSVDFVIIDEQHRFGVEQRHALTQENNGRAPHLLSMTATPIPRSLALAVYGDLEVSILNERPVGRLPITTTLITKPKEKEMYEKIKVEIKSGHQVFVVCPLIDPSDSLGVASAKETVEKLSKGQLKEFKLGLLHGQMRSDDKEKIMAEFVAGKIEVLVSTTVIEVGVDVPNATAMIIFGAERFGLAQLHQLRGRIGRSSFPSFCFLHTEKVEAETSRRLQAVVKSQDGFYLAEEDLKIRGAGNAFGTAQSGLPDLKFATLGDTDLMKKARDWAHHLLEKDPDLISHPLVKERVLQGFEVVHLE
ncbi:MAG: ATP-dependent DNA helicase RecG [Patescibacteria group bacterium]|jgi:ATP-dependent DNA helicase RecG